ncbi:TPA: type I DNA topoisomerase [Candidatus Uhrbacteria bacterium]|nr:type I DNA topoisomerase [Candidatus Uhrbacteria bacterium]
MSKLVIVESPTKAKTITKFLGKEYTILSSFGHIRDLPKKSTAVDVEHGFTPTYEVPPDKKAKVTALKQAAKGVDEVYLATDEDREGEAIAWHIAEVLKLNVATAKRITFHEITKAAIVNAVEHPRTIDMNMVNAQQTRRILDRLVGYELSPLLWKKVQRGLSAGRVQSVAVRLVVERELERNAFKSDEYWTIEATFEKGGAVLEAKLNSIDGKKLEKLDIKNEADAQKIVDNVTGVSFVVDKIELKDASRKPPIPLTTSSLQQDAYNRLGMSAKQTMTLAQKLYETGKITYMRTDSQNLAEQFTGATQEYLKSTFGAEFATGAVKYATKSKGAQEAHEAIRPTDVTASPESLQASLESGEWKLYDLIWRRTVASQMPSAKIRRTAVDLLGNKHIFRVNGSTVVFPGFMKVWQASEDKLLPTMAQGDVIGEAKEIKPEQHFTEPAARYSDATLIKALEEYGIGRPSTYAPTLTTIIDRGYVLRDDNKKLFPSDIAIIVTDLLKTHFPNIVGYDFTADMEGKLDEVAEGKQDWQKILGEFYGPFHAQIVEKTGDLTRADVMKERSLGVDPKDGLEIIVRTGRFGPYVQRGIVSDENPKPPRASLTKDQLMDTITLDQALKLLLLPRLVGKHTNGEDIIANLGRFGPYLKCGAVNITLPPEDHPAEVTLERAIQICTEGVAKKAAAMKPLAELGTDPTSKGEIVIRSGRFGDYITDGKTNVTVPKKMTWQDVTSEMAIEMLTKKRASPKKAWGKRKKKGEDSEE